MPAPLSQSRVVTAISSGLASTEAGGSFRGTRWKVCPLNRRRWEWIVAFSEGDGSSHRRRLKLLWDQTQLELVAASIYEDQDPDEIIVLSIFSRVNLALISATISDVRVEDVGA